MLFFLSRNDKLIFFDDLEPVYLLMFSVESISKKYFFIMCFFHHPKMSKNIKVLIDIFLKILSKFEQK